MVSNSHDYNGSESCSARPNSGNIRMFWVPPFPIYYIGSFANSSWTSSPMKMFISLEIFTPHFLLIGNIIEIFTFSKSNHNSWDLIFNIETIILFGQFLKSINAKYFTNLHLLYEFPQSSDFPHSKSELLFHKKYQNVPQNCSQTFRVRSSTDYTKYIFSTNYMYFNTYLV